MISTSRIVECQFSGCPQEGLRVHIDADCQVKYAPTTKDDGSKDYKRVEFVSWPNLVCAGCGVEPVIVA